jgi:hypothetical protein
LVEITQVRDEGWAPPARGSPESAAGEAGLGKKLLSEITTKDLERFIGEAVAPATKNRYLGALRIFLGWAVRVGLIEKLPTTGIQRVHETPRTRVLSDDEIRILIRKFDETRYGRALQEAGRRASRRRDHPRHPSNGGRLPVQPDRRPTLGRGPRGPWPCAPLRTYMPTLPLKEAREALQKWGVELAGILEGPTTIDKPRLPLDRVGASEGY